jgi:hypothetical protein
VFKTEDVACFDLVSFEEQAVSPVEEPAFKRS